MKLRKGLHGELIDEEGIVREDIEEEDIRYIATEVYESPKEICQLCGKGVERTELIITPDLRLKVCDECWRRWWP